MRSERSGKDPSSSSLEGPGKVVAFLVGECARDLLATTQAVRSKGETQAFRPIPLVARRGEPLQEPDARRQRV